MVLIGGQPAARVSDKLTCIGPPDTIMKGSFVVPISGKPAARMTDTTAHGGVIIAGCPTVLIGLAGVAGNVAAGGAMFTAASKGRTSGSTQQSYSNCGVESSRQIINQATNANISEDALLTQAINANLAQGTPGQPPTIQDGGSTPAERQALLANNGVPSIVMPTTDENISTALSDGRGTIVSVDAAPIWGPGTRIGSYHAVTVTGAEYDDAGQITNVIINDTGTGTGSQSVPAATFHQAVAARGSSQLNITSTPIWQ
jgi:hypothetical protein